MTYIVRKEETYMQCWTFLCKCTAVSVRIFIDFADCVTHLKNYQSKFKDTTPPFKRLLFSFKQRWIEKFQKRKKTRFIIMTGTFVLFVFMYQVLWLKSLRFLFRLGTEVATRGIFILENSFAWACHPLHREVILCLEKLWPSWQNTSLWKSLSFVLPFKI